MAKRYQKFYYIKGEVYKESNARKSYAFAKHYAEENGYSLDDIYELHNDSELEFLKRLLLLIRDVAGVKTHEQIELIKSFYNNIGYSIPSCKLDVSFTFYTETRHHYVIVVDSVYELTRELILTKTLFDYLGKDKGCYLEVYYLDKEEFNEWQIGDNTHFINAREENHKKLLAQRRAIRDREKYERLLHAREKGTISDGQRRELYRLEKVFGGK